MKVAVAQIYIEPGASFPFSYLMQRWLSQELSSLATPTNAFLKRNGEGFMLTVYISAKTKAESNEIRGPSVAKKSKIVEYTLFLPYDVIDRSEDRCRAAMTHIVTGIQSIFQLAEIEAEGLEARRAAILDHVCADPTMLEEPWPNRGLARS
jgi:hypothetical protein